MQFELQLFEYEEENVFRVIDRNGEPWFVLSEVCRQLGVNNVSDAAARLDDDEKDNIDIIDAIKRKRKTRIINESGLYSLILTSRKAEAKRFKKWVTSEVLPTIRKTGSYGRKVPAFIRRFNANWDRVSPGHFSVISELVIRLWGRLEQVGHVMADKTKEGVELRPDVSVGRCFAEWLRQNHPEAGDDFSYYTHKTPETEVEARQYPIKYLPLFIQFVDERWIPEKATNYFKQRDPAAVPHIPKLLPPPKTHAA